MNVTVIKRNGINTQLDISKIRKVATWACEGLDASVEALEAGMKAKLRNGVTTRDIQKSLIQCALELCSLEAPDYRYVAGRLHVWNIWKEVELARGCYYGDYDKVVIGMVNTNKYDPSIIESYTLTELKQAGEWINPDYDSDYDYAGASLLSKRYLLEKELPQEMYLTIALLLAKDLDYGSRLTTARSYYEALAQRKVSLATPFLSNLRKPNGSLTSCFVLTMNDTLESIFRELTNIARISKCGGGVGTNVSRIRATGSSLMGKANAAKGVVPWIQLINNTMIAVDQAGTRTGAATVALDVWHYDIPFFLELQTEHGDQRRKAYDIFPQVVIPDEFMRRVKNNQVWHLVCPHEVKEKFGHDLSSLWGKEFEEAYADIENAIEDNALKLVKKINAKELFIKMMKSQIETGMPYLAFKDTINRANPNKYEGYIPSVNLCVSGETKILTDKGHFAIADLVGQKVTVWNGSEWSNVLIKKTGENQPLLKVNFSNGESLECTYYHHFWVQDTYSSKPRRVEAKDLQPNDKLIKYQLPLIESTDDVDFPYAYTQGCFSGDGSYSVKGYPEIYLYGKKKQLVTRLSIRNKLQGNSSYIKELEDIAIYDNYKQDRLVCQLPLDILPKFTVPLNGYTIKSRLEWLAGLLDTDGTVCRNGDNESLSISSINKTFLLDVRLMLQTLGVDSKVTAMTDAGNRLLPDGKGSKKEYFCKQSYRLLISSNGLFQLSELGLKPYRLKWKKRHPQREASQFIKVVEVELTCRKDDTYCFSEPKRHLGMFNGILTGQCTESYSNVVSGQYAHCCNLISLNLATIEREKIGYYSELSVRMLNASLDLTVPPFADAKAHNDRYRTIGVGAMGLADYLAKNELLYDSDEARKEVDMLFEDITYHCINASMEMAKETNSPFPAYPNSIWAKGNFMNDLSLKEVCDMAYSKQRWVSLAEDIRQYGLYNSQLQAIAPNTSSSLVHGCTASILPTYSRFFYDKSVKPIAPPYINDYFWYYQENRTMPQSAVIKMTSSIQKWIDTGISMELLFNLNEGIYWAEEPTRKINAGDIFKDLIFAWESGCKAVYYVRSVQKDDYKDCTSCAN